MMLGQDAIGLIRPPEPFDTDCQDTAVAGGLPLGCKLGEPLPSTSSLASTHFKALVRIENDSDLAYQLRKMYEFQTFGAHKN